MKLALARTAFSWRTTIACSDLSHRDHECGVQTNGYQPVHLAAQFGNMKALQELLKDEKKAFKSTVCMAGP